ncbi:glycosyltransferase [Aliikangiella sp. IMCC44653]
MVQKLSTEKPILLVIGYVWPEPQSSAAGSHILSLMRFLQSTYKVIFATPSQPTEHMIKLGDEGIESLAIELNSASFDTELEKINPQVVLFDRFMMEEQFGWRVSKVCPLAVKILDTEDLQCLRNARELAHKQNRVFDTSDLLDNDLAKREIAAILRCDLSLIISQFEMEILQQVFKVDANYLIHIPFLLKLNAAPIFNESQNPSFSQRQHFMTIGNFRHAPNWDSVLFLQQIWPKIKRRLPQAELHIYGSYPPKKATQLHNPKQGFLVKGWVDNAFKVLQQARICLAPLRFGAGLKGKLIDAMQCATPSVTTSIGAEAMHGELAWPGLIANTADEIANAAVQLYQDEGLWEQSRLNAATILEQHYNSELYTQKLAIKLQQIQLNLDTHRRNNFSGAMLNHHLLKSCEYMSRWIEAKNKLNSN